MSTIPRRGFAMLRALAVATVLATAAASAPTKLARAQAPDLPPAATSATASAGVAEPRDVEYPGTLRLEVDLRDVERRVIRVRETVPVSPGRLTLLYPKWLPGNHAPSGPIGSFAGLEVRAGQRQLDWQRDALDMHAFHVEVPPEARELVLDFQFLTPGPGDSGRRVMTAALVGLQWEKSLLYPAGHYARRIQVQPSILLPDAQWGFAAALEVERREGARVEFRPVTLEMLVDSPLFAGPHHRRFTLDENERPAFLNAFADRPELLEASAAQIEAHRQLVAQTVALFGGRRPYRRYDFLLALSDQFSSIGLEHHQSSENGVGPDYFTEWDSSFDDRDLLAHELVHSWNGKYRRPADLWTAQYNVPMGNSLLWVYEGMTQYWGFVLAARSGLWSVEQTRDALAYVAAVHADQRAGRQWRSLQDTTLQPIIAYRVPQPYPSWQRSVDYYDEGLLLWLDVDTRLREATRERRSLDDFARSFIGARDGELGPSLYRFEDVLAALEALAPLDWRALLRARLDGRAEAAPTLLAGLERAGWRLVYAEKPNAYHSSVERSRRQTILNSSIGLSVASEGARISTVVWGSPAFEAGLAPGMTLVAVNGRAYSSTLLKDAVAATGKAGGAPLDLLIRDADRYRTVSLRYSGGARYARLERIEGRPDRLTQLLAPRSTSRAGLR